MGCIVLDHGEGRERGLLDCPLVRGFREGEHRKRVGYGGEGVRVWGYRGLVGVTLVDVDVMTRGNNTERIEDAMGQTAVYPPMSTVHSQCCEPKTGSVLVGLSRPKTNFFVFFLFFFSVFAVSVLRAKSRPKPTDCSVQNRKTDRASSRFRFTTLFPVNRGRRGGQGVSQILTECASELKN